MTTKEITVTVQASGYELMQHLAKLVSAYKVALADGWQPGTDVPTIVMGVISEGPGMIANIQALPGDLKENQVAFIKGCNIGLYDVVEPFVKK